MYTSRIKPMIGKELPCGAYSLGLLLDSRTEEFYFQESERLTN